MIQFEKTAKISKKGQITLPKAVRDLMRTDLVRVVVDDGQVRLEPVESVGGSLKRYAEDYIPMETARERAWQAAANEKDQRR